MKNIINLIVLESANEKRIDSFLHENLKDISRTKIKEFIKDGNLKINLKNIKNPSKKIKFKDQIKLIIPDEKKVTLNSYDYKLDIIYEDDDIIVINKKSGISIHPGAGNYKKTIVNALLKYTDKKLSDIGGEFRPGIVHRIDKNTSGIIVIAKNNFSHQNLSNQFKLHNVNRIYNALIWGKLRPASGRIETFIKRSSKNRQLMEVSFTKGKKAITNYKTIEVFQNNKVPTFSLLECKLETGRTHQIRVHLSHKGNNILGDSQYKKRFKNIEFINDELKKKLTYLDRQFLHAKTLGFIHPRSNKKLQFTSNLPEELNSILKSLRNA